jgi:selenocysteine-specific elongation factor
LMARESETPLTSEELQRKCLLRADEIGPVLEALRAETRVLQTPAGGWAHRATVDQIASRVLAELRTFHAANPQRLGLARTSLLATLKVAPALLDLATAQIVDQRLATWNGELLALDGWQPQVPDRDQQLCDDIEARLQRGGLTPPGSDELAAALQQSPARLAVVLRLLAERGRIFRLDDRVWMHRDALDAGKQTVLRLLHRAPSFTTMDFRDALGVSRKFAVPLLDYLDKLRFTVRSGHNRTAGVEARKLLNPATANAAVQPATTEVQPR